MKITTTEQTMPITIHRLSDNAALWSGEASRDLVEAYIANCGPDGTGSAWAKAFLDDSFGIDPNTAVWVESEFLEDDDTPDWPSGVKYYGFSSANHSDEPAWFHSREAAVRFANSCGWPDTEPEEAWGVDEADVMDTPETPWRKAE